MCLENLFETPKLETPRKYEVRLLNYEVRFTNLKTDCYDRTINKKQNHKPETPNFRPRFVHNSAHYILRSTLKTLAPSISLFDSAEQRMVKAQHKL